MKKYAELKYEGKKYKKEFEIRSIIIENKMEWFIDAEVENLRLEIMKDTLIINGGIWYNGTFEYGVIRDVDWRAGTFENGVIYNGVFKQITVEKGIIFNGMFLKGDVLFADIRGGDFKDVNISSNVNNTIQAKSHPKSTETTQPTPSGQNVQVQPTNTPDTQVAPVVITAERKVHNYLTFVKILNENNSLQKIKLPEVVKEKIKEYLNKEDIKCYNAEDFLGTNKIYFSN